MDNVNARQPSGSLKISKDVLETIARSAAMEVEGVASLASFGGERGLFGRKAIKISLSDDFAEINIGVRLRFGASIPQVCTNIQGGIKDSVQTMTGLAVSKVNVMVAGIEIPIEESAAN